jgi:hypothetical protein
LQKNEGADIFGYTRLALAEKKRFCKERIIILPQAMLYFISCKTKWHNKICHNYIFCGDLYDA